MNQNIKSVTAFAPATVANVAVGFDLLGFPIEGVGDEVTITLTEKIGVEITSITGIESNLPLDPTKNTATVGLLQLLKDVNAHFGFSVSIKKGIPMSSGMGGSATSSVAAILAANSLLSSPLPIEKLFYYAMIGEAVASGGHHGDNIAPCLYGGLTLCRSIHPVDIIHIPIPTGVFCVLVHPNIQLSTKESRNKLRKEVLLVDHVRQSAAMAGFIAGCFQNDLNLIQRSFQDIIIEPQRANQIPGFLEAKKAALDSNAIGCAISGSGPSVFAWARTKSDAEAIQISMLNAFKPFNIKTNSWISPLSLMGARIIT